LEQVLRVHICKMKTKSSWFACSVLLLVAADIKGSPMESGTKILFHKLTHEVGSEKRYEYELQFI
jgi:hypothetical protein